MLYVFPIYAISAPSYPISPSLFLKGKLISETQQQLLSRQISIDIIPKIKVFLVTSVDSQSRYLSENNRRLWLFKELEKIGFLSEIEVRLERSTKQKYRVNTYSKEAKLMMEKGDMGKSGKKGVGSGGDVEHSDE